MTRREFIGLMTAIFMTATAKGQSDRFEYEVPPAPVLTVKTTETGAVLNWKGKESDEWQLLGMK